jgi:hypothetical protein
MGKPITFNVPKNEWRRYQVMSTEVSSRSAGRMVMALSREELYVVKRLLKAKQIPGFDLAWLKMKADGSVPDEVQQSLEAAANGLVARGYLSPATVPAGGEPVQISMPSPVIALVGAAAFSDFTLFLSLQHTPEGPLRVYLHGFRELAVLHSLSVPGIHLFEPLEGRESVLNVVSELLHLRSQQLLSLPVGEVTASAVALAREAAIVGNVDQAAQHLIVGGLPSQTAQVLAQALHKALVIGALAVGSRNADNKVEHRIYAVVITAETCFLLTDGTSMPPAFLVQSSSAETLLHIISTP